MNRPSKQCYAVDVDVTVVHTTERSVLVNDGQDDVWLPLAQIEISAIGKGQSATVTLPQWLAEEKGLA